MKLNFFKKIILFLICVMLLCGCGETAKETASDSSKTESVGTNSIVDSQSDISSVNSSTNSSEIISSNNSSTATTNSQSSADPQKFTDRADNGAAVDIQKVTPKNGKANGIDVSKWQGKIDWTAVKKAGINFAYIRIGYRAENGVIYEDANAHYNIQQADKAGILIGVYFFSTAVNTDEAVKEAQWTAKQIKSYSVSYPVVYDCEGFTDSDSRMKNLTNAQRTDNALAFLTEITKQGYEGMFYAAKGQIENSALWDISRIEQKYKVWVAHYDSNPYPQKETPNYSGKFDMWQYTNKGKVSGIKGEVDLNVSYFTKTKAKPKSSSAPVTAQEPKENDPNYSAVNEKVTAKELVNLREQPNQNAKIVGKFKNGEVLTRTAVGVNGWSKLTYNGKTVYAVSSYLTTDLKYKPPVSSENSDGFTKTEEKVTAKDVVNLREKPTTNSNAVASLKNGEVAVRIGINKTTGWSKLTFNGKTVYAVTSFLTTDLTPKKPTESTSSTDGGFTSVYQKVTAKSETNLRTKPSTGDGSTVVYTLKNGEIITRTGVNTATGWSKLEYNGQTVYAITSYLIESE